MTLKCYSVMCRETDGTEHTVGVMAADEFSARHAAVNSLFEGQHISAKAVRCERTDKI